MADLEGLLVDVVGAAHVLTGGAISDDYAHDEALTVAPQLPAFLVRPGTTAEVAGVLRIANEHRVPVTARGSGTGLSGAVVPRADGMVVSFERMNRGARDRRGEPRRGRAAGRAPWRSSTRSPSSTASCTPCTPASTAPASAATSRRTPAACGR